MDGSGFDIGGDRRWYAVRAQPRKEELARLHLNRQGFKTFLPTIRKVVRRPTKTETVWNPFFPGYLFVRLSLTRDQWRSVNGTIGVIKLVQFGDKPTPAPTSFIEDLIDLSTASGEVRFDDEIALGAAVRIVGGPFDGLAGVLHAKGPDERVTVLLNLLSREVRVGVAKASVMAS